MKIRFLKNNLEPRRFNYIPVFYDEQKEYLEAKKAQFSKQSDEIIADEELRKTALRQELKQTWSRGEGKQMNASQGIRVLLLIAILCALGYFLLFGIEQIDTVVEKLW